MNTRTPKKFKFTIGIEPRESQEQISILKLIFHMLNKWTKSHFIRVSLKRIFYFKVIWFTKIVLDEEMKTSRKKKTGEKR